MEAVTPFKFSVTGLVILDRATKHNEEMKASMEKVLADNGKNYNVWNPLFNGTGDQKDLKGVVRSTLKGIFDRVGNNVYNNQNTLVLADASLPKTAKALENLLPPVISSIENAMPFKPDFVMSLDQIRVTVETSEGNSEAPVKTKAQKADLTFKDFVSVTGWHSVTPVSAENMFTTVNLSICVKFVASEIEVAKLAPDIKTMEELVEKHCAKKCHVGILFDSAKMTADDYALVGDLLKKGYKVYTPTRTLTGEKWLPSSKDKMESMIFKALSGEKTDFLVVK